MKITVTKEDIERGRKRDPNNCAVAMALRRAGVSHFGVTGMLVCVAAGPTSVVLPGPVQEWIIDFDRGAPVRPMEFELSWPEAAEQVRPRASEPERADPVGEPLSAFSSLWCGARRNQPASSGTSRNAGGDAQGTKRLVVRWQADEELELAA